MSEQISLGDDDGFADVTIGETTVTIDLFAVNGRLWDFHQAHQKEGDAQYNQGLVDLMMELGLPRVSHHMAIKFARAISAAVEALSKKN